MDPARRRQRILGAVLGVVGLGTFLGAIISPLIAESSRLATAIEDSRARVARQGAELKKHAREEQQAAQDAPLNAWAEHVLAALPNPFLVQAHDGFSTVLGDHQIEHASIRPQHVVPFHGLPNLAVSTWKIDLPRCQPLALGAALAGFENKFPLGKLAELSIRSSDASGAIDAELLFQTVVVP
jgi:hypothetical protein